MEFSQFTTHLTTDAARLGRAADGKLANVVPSCPEWTMGDLVEHMAMVYAHKVQCMRLNQEPQVWPPETDQPVPPVLTQLRIAEGDLLAEFAARGPSDPIYTWYEPDQTVGFWMRRMAHETLIHRVDAELAAEIPISDIDAALALDGIDELLMVCVDWGTRTFTDQVRDELQALDKSPVVMNAGDKSWTIRPSNGGIAVTEGSDPDAKVTIAGTPAQLMLWGWRRADVDSIKIDGDAAVAREFYDFLAAVTG